MSLSLLDAFGYRRLDVDRVGLLVATSDRLFYKADRSYIDIIDRDHNKESVVKNGKQ